MASNLETQRSLDKILELEKKVASFKMGFGALKEIKQILLEMLSLMRRNVK